MLVKVDCSEGEGSYHETGANTVGVDRLRGEHEVGVFLEESIDIATRWSVCVE